VKYCGSRLETISKIFDHNIGVTGPVVATPTATEADFQFHEEESDEELDEDEVDFEQSEASSMQPFQEGDHGLTIETLLEHAELVGDMSLR